MRLPSVRKPWIGYVLLGIGVYAVFLIAYTPASWVSWFLARATKGKTVISQPIGTIWSGSGDLVIVSPGSSAQGAGEVRWRVNPFWLFIGRIHGSVRAEVLGADVQAKVQIANREIQISRLQATLPAPDTQRIYPPAGMILPLGKFRLTSALVKIDKSGLHGKAEVFWENAGSRSFNLQQLGDYRLAFSGRGKSAGFTLSTLRGDLQLAGQGQWQALENGRLQFTGTAAAKARQNELAPLLNLIGTDQGGGRRAIRIDTRLALPIRF